MLERIQHRATRMISVFENKSYEERLKELGMFLVKRRFLRGDMIQVYKIFPSDSNTEIEKYFIVDCGRVTRGHDKKIKNKPCHLDLRKYSFSNRVFNFWNDLPQEIVDCDSLVKFKRGIDRYMDDLGII